MKLHTGVLGHFPVLKKIKRIDLSFKKKKSNFQSENQSVSSARPADFQSGPVREDLRSRWRLRGCSVSVCSSAAGKPRAGPERSAELGRTGSPCGATGSHLSLRRRCQCPPSPCAGRSLRRVPSVNHLFIRTGPY